MGGDVFRKWFLVNGSLNPNDYLFRYSVIIVPLYRRKISLRFLLFKHV